MRFQRLDPPKETQTLRPKRGNSIVATHTFKFQGLETLTSRFRGVQFLASWRPVRRLLNFSSRNEPKRPFFANPDREPCGANVKTQKLRSPRLRFQGLTPQRLKFPQRLRFPRLGPPKVEVSKFEVPRFDPSKVEVQGVAPKG